MKRPWRGGEPRPSFGWGLGISSGNALQLAPVALVPGTAFRGLGFIWRVSTATRRGLHGHVAALRVIVGSGTERVRVDWSTQGRPTMPKSNRDPITTETGEQVPARPHDSGSAANETVDGLDATTETIRRAAEDTPSGTGPGDIEKTPVFDRAGQAPKI